MVSTSAAVMIRTSEAPVKRADPTHPKMLLSSRPRGQVRVAIDGHYSSKIYTNGSVISGEAVVMPQEDIPHASVQISLTGTATTVVDAFVTPKITANTFLKMDMPTPNLEKSFLAGRRYTVPFEFKVPQVLAVTESKLHRPSEPARTLQTRLPPTVGGWEKRDLAPSSARITYEIRAAVSRDEDEEIVANMETSQVINILPSNPEDPPISITEDDTKFSLTRSKTIRTRFFAKQGRVTATLAPPATVLLDPKGEIPEGLERSINIDVEYQPVNSSDATHHEIPKIEHLSAKLVAQTYFSDIPMTRIPGMGNGQQDLIVRPDPCYQSTIPVHTQALDQQSCTLSEMTTAAGFRASLKIPIQSIATEERILPTFYSKLIARSYVLRVSLAVGGASLSLSAPVQVNVEGLEDEWDSAPLEEGALPSFDEVMRRRSL